MTIYSLFLLFGFVCGIGFTCGMLWFAVVIGRMIFKVNDKWCGEDDAFVDIYLVIMKGKELAESGK